MQKTKPTLRHALSFFFFLAFGTLCSAAEGNPPEQMSILQMILHGGPLIIMIWLCIVGTSMILVTFCIQLFMTLRAENLAPKALMESLTSTITAGNYQETWETCKANKCYAAKVLQGALERLGRGQDAVQSALIEHGLRLAQPIKTKISYISVIGVIAPMIGLLGTVIGMMGAFAVLGSSGVADPAASPCESAKCSWPRPAVFSSPSPHSFFIIISGISLQLWLAFRMTNSSTLLPIFPTRK